MRNSSIKSRLLLLITAIFAIAFATSCGGDGNGATGGDKTYSVYASTTVTTADLGRPQYVAHINKICRQAWVVITDNWHIYSRTQDPTLDKAERTKEAIQLSLLAGLDFHIFDEIQGLGAPRGDETTIEEIIGPFQAAVEIGQKHPTADSLDEVPAKFADYNQRARQYGLNDCLVDETHLSGIEA